MASMRKLIFLIFLYLCATFPEKGNGDNDGIVMDLYRMEDEEGSVSAEAGSNHHDRGYQRFVRMVQASKNRAWALKRRMHMKSISAEGYLYANSVDKYKFKAEYYIQVSFGTPPQNLKLVMDTGSDVVWMPCRKCNECDPNPSVVFDRKNSSTAVVVQCSDTKCRDLCASERCVGGIENCSRVCPKYKLQYGTGNAIGILLSETLALPLEDGRIREIPHFGVGCSLHWAVADGIAGFGRGALSMPSQLSQLSPPVAHKFAHCFQSHRLFDDTDKRSRIVLGDKAVPKGIILKYTSFLPNPVKTDTYYYVDLLSFSIGGNHVNQLSKLLRFDSNGNGGTVIDSGTSITTISEKIYQLVIHEFSSQIKYKRAGQYEHLEGDPDYKGPCYNVSGVQNVQFPIFTFHFNGSDMVLPGNNTFVHVHPDVFCLAMASFGAEAPPGVPAILLGNYQQQNFYILYDVENNRLGFAPKTCHRLG